MWEDEPPGYGRPQSRINERLDAADIFIGIVYRRWGTPTGDYSSGFDEELSRALERRHTGGAPEIQLYLKNIPSELSEDPGPQLEQVLAFRQRIEANGELLYKTFPDTETFATVLSDAIVANLIDIDRARTAARAESLRREADTAGVEERDAAEAAFAAEEIKYLLARAMNVLPEREKIVMTLAYFEGMSTEELAAVLGASAADIERLHTKARLALRASLAASGIDVEEALRKAPRG